MADIKWIKITTNMFDDEKIKLIQSMPEGDSILVIWIRLICTAGKCNNGGYVYMTESIPYTEEMLATIFNKPVNIVRLALKTFEAFKMIELDEQGIFLVNFENHQNTEGLKKIREQNKLRKQKERESKKLLSENVTRDICVTSHKNHATDIDIELEKNIKKERKKEQKTFDDFIFEYTDNEKLKETILNYIKMRINKKAKPTNNALELIFKDLDKFSNGDINIKIQILENSIKSNWTGVFALKDEQIKKNNNLEGVVF